MGADKKVSPPLAEAINDLRLRLHDHIAQCNALVVAATTISGLARFNTDGLDLLRRLIIVIGEAAADSYAVSISLKEALAAAKERP